MVTPLIEKAAFMSIELDDLQETIEQEGWTSEYKNGENQYGTKKSPEAETYIALSKNYAAVIKQLVDLVPAAKRKNKIGRNERGIAMAIHKNYIYEYYKKISSGEIIAGELIKAIYKIITDRLEKQEYFLMQRRQTKQ